MDKREDFARNDGGSIRKKREKKNQSPQPCLGRKKERTESTVYFLRERGKKKKKEGIGWGLQAKGEGEEERKTDITLMIQDQKRTLLTLLSRSRKKKLKDLWYQQRLPPHQEGGEGREENAISEG